LPRIGCLTLLLLILLIACDNNYPPNYPHLPIQDKNVLYSTISTLPECMDPALTSQAHDIKVMMHIVESLYTYEYLTRPYKLTTQLAAKMPVVRFDSVNNITEYIIEIKPDINYQFHPCFADANTIDNLNFTKIDNISEVKSYATRKVQVDDFIYQIKRMAHPANNSPVASFFSNYIVGFKDYYKYMAHNNESKPIWQLLSEHEIEGVKRINYTTFSIKIYGKYPQFKYWLATYFFAPMPIEAEKFYANPILSFKNISLKTSPVGSGPFVLSEYNAEQNIILTKNENYRDEYFPKVEQPQDLEAGFKKLEGQKLPMLDKVVLNLEKESIPIWNKFLQGYYDESGISADNFNNVIDISSNGNNSLTTELEQLGIKLEINSEPSVFYWAFNMLDKVIGGYSEHNKKLRHAISLAFNIEEYIEIFYNNRAKAITSVIPPGILGYNPSALEPYAKRLAKAKSMMQEMGYSNGYDSVGNKLQLYLEAYSSGSANSKASLQWIKKQFTKLGIDLIIRITDYNQFNKKIRKGIGQIYLLGWSGDYPDPENFMYIFYGDNSLAIAGGNNGSNYQNPKFDNLYLKLKHNIDKEEKQKIVHTMNDILYADKPWMAGIFPESYVLSHHWKYPAKNNNFANDRFKYIKINSDARTQYQLKYNQPLKWPLFIVLFIMIIIALLIIFIIYNNSQAKAKRY